MKDCSFRSLRKLSDPQRLPPERQPYSQVALTGGLIDSPSERDVIDSHAHMRVMNPFVIILASRLRPQYQFAEVGVDIAVVQKPLLVHQGRGHDPAMLYDLP